MREIDSHIWILRESMRIFSPGPDHIHVHVHLDIEFIFIPIAM